MKKLLVTALAVLSLSVNPVSLGTAYAANEGPTDAMESYESIAFPTVRPTPPEEESHTDIPLPEPCPPPIEASPFRDTADPAVIRAADLGIIHGDGDGYFRPTEPMTHAEYAVICFNSFKASLRPYPEVPWYEPAYNWLYQTTVADWAAAVDNITMLSIFETYTDGRTAETFNREDTFVSYRHIITTLYLISAAAPGSEKQVTMNLVQDALTWAIEMGFGPDGLGWRYHPAPAPGQITREDAVRLFLGLTELT